MSDLNALVSANIGPIVGLLVVAVAILRACSWSWHGVPRGSRRAWRR